MIRTLLRTGMRSTVSRFRKTGSEPPTVPGPTLTATVPARNARLVRDYVRHVGGDPDSYVDSLPPHMFPQWGLPLLARTLDNVPYDVSRVLNAGCRLEVNRPLPTNEPLQLEGRLEEIDDNGQRAILRQRLVTGTASAPEALICRVDAILRLASPGGGVKRPKPTVPEDARQIGRWCASKYDGLRFGLLTGDLNPIHWVGLYARMFGLGGVILHGFSTMARTAEILDRSLRPDHPTGLRTLEVRFERPVRLPADVGVYVDEGDCVFAGESPGAPAYLTGQYTTSQDD